VPLFTIAHPLEKSTQLEALHADFLHPPKSLAMHPIRHEDEDKDERGTFPGPKTRQRVRT
jgi:hypothetical protein